MDILSLVPGLLLGHKVAESSVFPPDRSFATGQALTQILRSPRLKPRPSINVLFLPAECLRYHRTMKIGYTRLCTHDQTHDLQLDALWTAGCERVYTNTYSGSVACADRLALQQLCADDVLVVWSIDRLDRDLKELLAFVDGLQVRDVHLQSLRDSLVDTTADTGQLVLQLFGILAEYERKRISERTRAELAAARARGRKEGRQLKMTPAKLDCAAELMRDRMFDIDEICRIVGVGQTTLWHYLTPNGERCAVKCPS